MQSTRFDSRPGKAPLASGFVAGVCAAALALASCGGGNPGGPEMGGSSGDANASGTAGDGQTGGNGVGGTTGAAGSGAGTSGSPGSGGSASGGAGATGTGGSAAGSAGRGGTIGTAGSGAAGGTAGVGGRGGTSGSSGTTGAAGRGGTTGTGGTTGGGGTAGAAGRGGSTGAAGTTGSGGTTTAACGTANPKCGFAPINPVTTQTCTGAQPRNANPFGCTFAWGRQNPSGSGSLSSYNYLQMIANWVESGVRADGTYASCGGCSWLQSRVAGTNLVPVYYAYIIGFMGHMNGLPDQNQSPNGPNLLTGGAAMIKAHRQQIVATYAKYAQDTYKVWPTKPLVWFLEGDFVQYSDCAQSDPLTMPELGQLAADITCAIKSNMPNAVVAFNHTTWNDDCETNSFWNEMKRADYDIVWTTGVGNNGNFIESAGAPGYYNAATATYPYLHALTGRTIAVDTSYGASGMSDSWSSQPVNVLNNHITNGVIGVNISTNPPSNYQTLIQNLGTLATTCR